MLLCPVSLHHKSYKRREGTNNSDGDVQILDALLTGSQNASHFIRKPRKPIISPLAATFQRSFKTGSTRDMPRLQAFFTIL